MALPKTNSFYTHGGELERALPVPHHRGPFLSRLFAISKSERNRLEDFLTEILGEILSTQRKDDLIKFFGDFFLNDQLDLKERWVRLAQSCAQITVHTQMQIQVPHVELKKRPDTVILGDRRPLALIECKVGAGYTWSGGMDSESGNEPGIEQLEAYGRWLDTDGHETAVLILLTQYSDPPPGFVSDKKFKVKGRSVRRWSDLYRFLTANATEYFSSNIILVKYLCEFARENNLMIDDIQGSDFAAANLYLGRRSHWKFLACLNEARAEIQEILRKHELSSFQRSPGIFQVEDEDWTWIGDIGWNAKCEIGWGFFWNTEDDMSSWKDYDPPWQLLEGVGMYVDPKGADAPPFERPNGAAFRAWTFPKTVSGQEDKCAYKVAAFLDFLRERDTNKRIGRWFVQAAQKAVDLLKLR